MMYYKVCVHDYCSGQRVFIHGAAATPVHLIEAMCHHGKKAGIRDVEVMHIHTEGPGLYNKPEYDGNLLSVCLNTK